MPEKEKEIVIIAREGNGMGIMIDKICEDYFNSGDKVFFLIDNSTPEYFSFVNYP